MLAYLDPGLGSLVVQSVVIGTLSVVAVFRRSVGRFFQFLGRLCGKGKNKDKG